MSRVDKSMDRLARARGQLIARILFHRANRIVIASTGRCGSTMLCDAVARGFIKQRFGLSPDNWAGRRLARLSKRFVGRLVDVQNFAEPIQKTHDLYEGQGPRGVKYVFVYGDPLDSAQSVEAMVEKRGSGWLDKHLFHLRSAGNLSELYSKDILNYEKQIKCWLDRDDSEIFAVRYEELWDRLEELSEFLGFGVSLPSRRPRSQKPIRPDVDANLFRRLKAVERRYSGQLKRRARKGRSGDLPDF